MSKNDITGDEIKSKVNTKEYEDNYEKIFGKKKYSNCPNFPNPCGCTGACKEPWNEVRMDTVGQNGNTGDHYEEKGE